jgi:hypothetical protein
MDSINEIFVKTINGFNNTNKDKYTLVYINTYNNITRTYINNLSHQISCLLFDHIPVLYKYESDTKQEYTIITWNIGTYTQFHTWNIGTYTQYYPWDISDKCKYNNLLDILFINKNKDQYQYYRFNYNLSIYNIDNFLVFSKELDLIYDNLLMYYKYLTCKSNVVYYVLNTYITKLNHINIIICLQEIDNSQNDFWLEKELCNDLKKKIYEINTCYIYDINIYNNIVIKINKVLDYLYNIINNKSIQYYSIRDILNNICKTHKLKIVNDKYKNLMLIHDTYDYYNNNITTHLKNEKYFYKLINGSYKIDQSIENKCIGNLMLLNNDIKILNLHNSVNTLTFNTIYNYYKESNYRDDDGNYIDLDNINIICGDFNTSYYNFMNNIYIYELIKLSHPPNKDYDIIAIIKKKTEPNINQYRIKYNVIK